MGIKTDKTEQSKKRLPVRAKVVLALVSGLLILIGVGVFTLHNVSSLNSTTTLRKQSLQAEVASNLLLANMIDAETGQRGYLLTGQTSYLAPYTSAVNNETSAVNYLLSLTTSTTNRALVNTTDQLIKKKLAELNQTITLRKTQGFSAALAVVLTGQGKSYMDQIRSTIAQLNANEEAAVVVYSARANLLASNTTWTIVAGTALSSLIVASAIFFVNRDLAERERTRKTLAESEARLEAILNTMTEGLIVTDSAGSFTLFNKMAEKLLGIGKLNATPEERSKHYGLYFSDKITPIPVADLPFTHALHGEEKYDMEMFVRNEKVKVGRFINVSSAPLYDEHHTVVGGVAVFNDITARKEAEAKLLNEKAKAEATLSSIGDGVFAIDPSGTIILFNRTAEALSGRMSKEALGKPYTDIFAFYNEKDGHVVDQFIVDALHGKKASMAADTNLRRADGGIIPIADSAAPIVGADGVEGAVVVFRDITRDRELARLKDEFVSIASHELRTPMGAIRAFVTMILDGDYGPVNANLIEPLTDIRSSTIRLVQLVNDMLDTARIEAGRMKFELVASDLGNLIKEVTASLIPLAKEKSIELKYVNPNEHATVLIDTNKVKQVLTNLISNALKFTDKGSIHVTMKPHDDTVAVIIKDTGIGMKEEDQGKLFTKFEQIASDQKGRPAGTGLGLYISRQIIRKLGGDLRLTHSEPSIGSTFEFTLVKTNTKAAESIQAQIAGEAELHPNQK